MCQARPRVDKQKFHGEKFPPRVDFIGSAAVLNLNFISLRGLTQDFFPSETLALLSWIKKALAAAF